MPDFPFVPGFCDPAKARLAGMLDTPGLSDFRRTEVYCLMRRLHNRELAARLSRPVRMTDEVLDGGALAAALFAACREVCPFCPEGLVQELCPRPLPLRLAGQDFSAVLLGLVCNAFLYAGSRSGPPRLLLKTGRQGGQAVFELSDCGPGLPVPPEFPPAGGLNLARLLAHRYGGRFLLDSSADGCRAVLSLPLCPAAALPPPLSAADFLKDRFSPVFIQLAPRCILPDT